MSQAWQYACIIPTLSQGHPGLHSEFETSQRNTRHKNVKSPGAAVISRDEPSDVGAGNQTLSGSLVEQQVLLTKAYSEMTVYLVYDRVPCL